MSNARFVAAALLAAFLIESASAQKLPLVVDGNGYSPQIAASGAAVYSVWNARSTSASKHDIYCNRSLDGGATWLPTSQRVSTGTPAGTSDALGASVAAVGDTVYVVWMEYRASATNADIYFNRSLDRGATWLPAVVRLDSGSLPGGSKSGVPSLAVSGTAVYVAWSDHRNGLYYPDVYFNRSLDQGTTWLPTDLRLDTGIAAGAGGAEAVQVVADGSEVHVVWADSRNGTSNFDIHYNRSVDRGSTWLAVDVRINVGRPSGASLAYRPTLAADQGHVCVVWQDSVWANSNADIYCNRSLDSGSTWLPAAMRLDTASAPFVDDSRYPIVHVSGSTALVVWQERASVTARHDIYCNRSADGGTTWLAAPVRLDTGSATGAAESFYPVLAASSTSVYVAWTDTRVAGSPAGSDVYYNRSLDGGATWLATDVRLSIGPAPSSGGSFPRLASGGGSFHAVWQRFGYYWPYMVWYTILSGYQPYGIGTPGTGGAVPVASAGGTASIGSTFQLTWSGGLGGAAGLVILGVGPGSKVQQPLLGGTLLVQPSGTAQTVAILLGGTVGVPGAGTGAVAIPVPNHAVLLGLNANFQGLFLDPAAVGGVSMSNGLETWIG